MGMLDMFTRAIRPPPDDITPNPNDPASVPPSTVGPDQLVTPGDPSGLVFDFDPHAPSLPPPRIMPSAWSGWPAEWWPPPWGNGYVQLTDTAWMCIDYNASTLASMPPYLVGAADSLSADWLRNPDPELYTHWDEFSKQAFWDYQAFGETFVLATARYASGWPARFHVVPPSMVEVDMDAGRRRYRIGQEDVSDDILQIRYQSSTTDARGHGPLEAAAARVRASGALTQYATQLVGQGGIPASVLEHPNTLSAEQATALRTQWVAARASSLGEPAVLSGGVTWKPTQLNPVDMALLDLAQYTDSRIASLLKVPPALVGIDTGESMTYANVVDRYVGHWRGGLRPMAHFVMGALSYWLLPRDTRVELNRDEYVQQEPLQRAQTYQILNSIVDPATGKPVLTVEQIQQAERLINSAPADLSTGVLR